MSPTTELSPETADMHAVAKIASIPTMSQVVNVPMGGAPRVVPLEGLAANPTQIAFSGSAIMVFMFFVGIMAPSDTIPAAKTPTTVTTPAAAAPAAPAAPAAASTVAATPPAAVHKPHHQAAWTRTGSYSYPQELTAHHLYGQDYSLTWKNMGAGTTYRVYYANDKQMHDAAAAFFRPIDGSSFRFTLGGDVQNVWMAVAPVDSTGHEQLLSRPVNIGEAKPS